MRYAYKDLGVQAAGTTVVVRWSGSAANVLLLDAVNFSKYRYTDGRPFFYDGGAHYARPPAEISIPQDGRWYVVVDLGGNARSAPTVEALAPQDTQPNPRRRRTRSQPQSARFRGIAASPALPEPEPAERLVLSVAGARIAELTWFPG
jgi:hypothetical protein